MKQIANIIKTSYWIQTLLNSYSLVFFSQSSVLALCLFSVTFFTPAVGLCGFFGVVLINVSAWFSGFNREEIKSGLFGFNALFLGMAMGYDYQFSLPFCILFMTAIFALLLLTVWLKGWLAIHKLPFLSIPFVITYWLISLSALQFSALSLDEKNVYVLNELVRQETSFFYGVVHSLDTCHWPSAIVIYFKTLSGIFFQNSVLGGVLIAFGLLYASRISFSLSVVGFLLAFLFYDIFGVDTNDLYYNLTGSNFIFLSIAIGCFFIIPNFYSYLTVALLTPILLILSLALGKLLGVFQLKAYSLSFSVLSTAFLFTLNQRWFHHYLQLVSIQYFSAETSIYKFLNSVQRFKNEHLYKVSLPFNGEWLVSQGYDGKITHLGDWSKALDFVIVDSKANTYREQVLLRDGFHLENFYCYAKEIVAPFEGYVYDIINTVEENDVGEVNTEHNWGNTIIINHLNGLFSQISHIKKDSIGVFLGQYVTRGTFLATCGNSGRSPEPHIHFQFQTIPLVGAKTLAYPISYFIERKGIDKFLRISEVPNEGAFISNVQVNELLMRSFALYPGVKWQFKNSQTGDLVIWEVFTDAYNRTYVYCFQSASTAYFVNDGVMLYFTDFEGDRQSLLFNFYLAAYRQVLGYYENITVNDQIPLIHFNNKGVQFLQDFVAPFYLFTKASFSSRFTYTDNPYAPQSIQIRAEIEAKVLGKTFKQRTYQMELNAGHLQRFIIHQKNKSVVYEAVELL